MQLHLPSNYFIKKFETVWMGLPRSPHISQTPRVRTLIPRKELSYSLCINEFKAVSIQSGHTSHIKTCHKLNYLLFLKFRYFSPRQQSAGAKPTTSGWFTKRKFHWLVEKNWLMKSQITYSIQFAGVDVRDRRRRAERKSIGILVVWKIEEETKCGPS